MPLTTQFLFKQYSGIEGTVAIQALIDQASKAIETHLDRSLESAIRKEWYDGTGRDYLLLCQYPITAVLGISTDTSDACDIKFAGGKFATLSISSTALTLYSINTLGVLTETELTFASHATVSLMATAIGAVTGWTATVSSGMGDYPTALLRPVTGAWSLSPDDYSIEVTDETEPARLVPDSDRMVRRASGVPFYAGISNVLVYYKAGYTLPVDNGGHDGLTTVGNVPADLALVCNQLVKALYDSGEQEMGIADSLTAGDHSYSIGEGSRGIVTKILKENMATLGKYRRMI